MPHLMLGWVDGGLVTIDLDDDSTVCLVLPDPELALALGQAVMAAANQPVEVVEIDAPADGIGAALDVLLGMAGFEGEVRVLFPEDPLWRAVVLSVLQG